MSQQYYRPELPQSPAGTIPPHYDPLQAPNPEHVQQQQYFVSPMQQPGEMPAQYQTQPHGEAPMQQQQYFVHATVQPGQMHQQVPMQQMQQLGMVGVMGQQQYQSRYLQATPIPALGRSAAPVDCPACGKREMTNVSYEVGNSTQ
jgi:lipopolysaccharide-induced tumor necrosis factor-alpha factor